jgi:hypothetical protein
MSIEINLDKFPEYPEIQRLLNGILEDNNKLINTLREIQMLNAMGKTLKIDEAIKSALDE